MNIEKEFLAEECGVEIGGEDLIIPNHPIKNAPQVLDYGLEIKRAMRSFEKSIREGSSMQEAAQKLNNSYGFCVYNYVINFINPNN